MRTVPSIFKKNRHTSFVLAVIAALLVFSSTLAAGAEDVTQQPDSQPLTIGAPLMTKTFTSGAAYDGWLLETAENGSAGGSFDKIATTFNVGDDARNRQYRGILSFNTISIPDGAIITSAKLKIKRQSLVGTDPFGTHGALLLDIRDSAFGQSAALELGDFSAPASSNGQEHLTALDSSWYAADLSNTNLRFITKVGVTQFRLRFTLDDNNDLGADYLKFFSSNSLDANMPQLIVTYYMPAPTLISPVDGFTTLAGKIKFTWSADSEATTKYLFEYSGTSKGTSGWISTPYYSAILSTGSYTWHVKAMNSAGEVSDWSLSRILNIVNLPPAPTLTSPANGAKVSAGTINFTWNTASGATKYLLGISDTSTCGTSKATSGWITTASYSTTLSVGTYTWCVKASNAGGESAWSLPRTFTVIPLSAPTLASPTNSATLPAGAINFTWNTVNGATKYLLGISDTTSCGTSKATSDWITTSTYSTTLPIGTYTWCVKAANAGGESAWSLPRTLTIFLPAPTPVSPTDGATLATGTINFSWSTVSNATEYKLEYNGASSGICDWNSAPSCSITLNTGTYTWRVKARNADGESVWSLPKTLTVILPAPTLASPTDSAALPIGAINFTWDSVNGATEYEYEYSDTSSFDPPMENSGWISATNYSVNLNAGTYYWHVKARNASGESDWSEIWTLTTYDTPTLVSPIDGATLPVGTINFTWNPVSNAAEYKLEYNGTASGICDWSSATSCPVDLNAGTYTWHVKARNAGDESNWSATWTVIVYSVPDVWVHVRETGFESTYKGNWVVLNPNTSTSIDANGMYTWTRTVGNTNDKDWAIWRPTVSTSGYYRICIFAPSYTVSGMGITDQARYTIYHADGNNLSIQAQSGSKGNWMDLGRYQFASGTAGYVYMGDYTGDNPWKIISADAAKFIWSPFDTETCQ
jgi:hypothetical protein